MYFSGFHVVSYIIKYPPLGWMLIVFALIVRRRRVYLVKRSRPNLLLS